MPSERVFAQTCSRTANAKSSVLVVIALRDIVSSLHTLPTTSSEKSMALIHTGVASGMGARIGGFGIPTSTSTLTRHLSKQPSHFRIIRGDGVFFTFESTNAPMRFFVV